MRAVTLLLILSLSPGFAEAAEDVAHWLNEGHTLHAPVVANADHDGHNEHEREHGDDEHGCSALFHVCGCHAPVPSMISAKLTIERTDQTAFEVSNVIAGDAHRVVEGIVAATFRPPIV